MRMKEMKCDLLTVIGAFLLCMYLPAACGLEYLEHNSMDFFSKPGKYGMGYMVVNAPKTSIFRQSYGTAPVAVYFPTSNGNSTTLAPEGTFSGIGFAHGAGSAAEFYSGLYAHIVSHGFIVVSVKNMAPVPATLGDDMCHGLAWLITESLGNGPYGKDSMFYGRVNTTGVGAMGHSMGTLARFCFLSFLTF